MPVIESRIDPQSEGFRANREQMLALIGDFRALEQKVRDASNARLERFRARKQLLPRERVTLLLDPGAPWLELATLSGFRMHRRRRRCRHPGRRRHRRHRLRVRHSLHGVGQRQRDQGGHRRPDGGEKASARARDRDAEQAADGPACGIGRRQPALSVGNVRRRRPRLCQSGAPVGGRHSAGHGRARIVDGRRRLSAWALRLCDPGAGPGEGVFGRTAAFARRHRRDRKRRGAGRRRDACHRLRAWRVSRRRRRRRHPARARNHGQAAVERTIAGARRRNPSRSRAMPPRSSPAWCRSTTASPTTCAK